MESNIGILILIISLCLVIYAFMWMNSMLKYTKRLRIMQSMQLQVLQQIAKEKGIEINLAKIAEEVEKTVK
ncbi:MAG: hypothetical protein BGO87_12755 [Flavobacteriia bacterium 40-80]|nr:MAG: hypothetical protein BGO87_12755 [Flavobacteriia bacterium 40-80]